MDLNQAIESNLYEKRQLDLFRSHKGAFEALLDYLDDWYVVRQEWDGDAYGYFQEHVCMEEHDGVLSFEVETAGVHKWIVDEWVCTDL